MSNRKYLLLMVVRAIGLHPVISMVHAKIVIGIHIAIGQQLTDYVAATSAGRRVFVVNGDLFGVPVGSSRFRYSYLLPVSVDISHKYTGHGSHNVHPLPDNLMPYPGRKKPHLSLIYQLCQVVAL